MSAKDHLERATNEEQLEHWLRENHPEGETSWSMVSSSQIAFCRSSGMRLIPACAATTCT